MTSGVKKAVFWDFDGTLTIPSHQWRRAAVKALGPLAERYGVTLEKAALRRGFPWHPDGDPTLKGKAWWTDRFRQYAALFQSLGVPRREAEKAARQMREILLSPENCRVRRDAASALALCAYKGYENYVLSNNYPELEKLLRQLFLRPYFKGYIVSGKVGLNKPDEQIFHLAEKNAGFPELIWMVGDNPVADIQGARAVGWKTALLRTDQNRLEKNGGATVEADSLLEIVKHF